MGNKIQNKFILNEFPEIKTELLDGYNITLSSKKSTYLQILKQGIKIIKSVKTENKWVTEYCTMNPVDIIISDNRYGFYNSATKSIFISHQLQIEVPVFKNIINKKLSKFINSFDLCWIPDNESFNLSGELSDTTLLKISAEYIGILSRFKKIEAELKYDYLFIVSGPKPENYLFLKTVEDKISRTQSKKIAVVSTTKSTQPNSEVDYFYHPTTKALNQLFNESQCVISKNGYTTIMELVALNKKAILIPTKGQFEQEYLAKHIKSKHITFVKNLNEVNLKT